MATLMVALIIYCVRLNRRLTLLRDQEAQMAEMITGFREASDRAEQSAQRLKAAGLAAERSLRSAVLEAEAVRRDLAPPVEPSPPAKSEGASPEAAPVVDLAQAGATNGVQSPPQAHVPAEPRPPKRDMLMGEQSAAPGPTDTPKRAETREEAEQAVLEAIRSARSGVA